MSCNAMACVHTPEHGAVLLWAPATSHTGTDGNSNNTPCFETVIALDFYTTCLNRGNLNFYQSNCLLQEVGFFSGGGGWRQGVKECLVQYLF